MIHDSAFLKSFFPDGNVSVTRQYVFTSPLFNVQEVSSERAGCQQSLSFVSILSTLDSNSSFLRGHEQWRTSQKMLTALLIKIVESRITIWITTNNFLRIPLGERDDLQKTFQLVDAMIEWFYNMFSKYLLKDMSRTLASF